MSFPNKLSDLKDRMASSSFYSMIQIGVINFGDKVKCASPYLLSLGNFWAISGSFSIVLWL